MNKPFNKAERIKCLKNGKGIQYLLNEAYEILGNPILIHDMEYKAIGYTKNVTTDDPIWNEYVTRGTVGSEWLDFFKNECFIEDAANAKNITFLTSKKLEYERIYGKVFNKHNIQIGCAVLTACHKPFEYDDPALFEALCAILTKELGKSEFYNAYGQAYFEKLVGELVAGIRDIALYAAHVESIYMNLKSILYLAVVDIGRSDAADLKLTFHRDLLKKAQPEYAYAIYSNYILIIISTDDAELLIDRDLKQLNRVFQKHNIYAGISRAFENLFDLDKYYIEALDVLNGGAENAGRIFLCERNE